MLKRENFGCCGITFSCPMKQSQMLLQKQSLCRRGTRHEYKTFPANQKHYLCLNTQCVNSLKSYKGSPTFSHLPAFAFETISYCFLSTW